MWFGDRKRQLVDVLPKQGTILCRVNDHRVRFFHFRGLNMNRGKEKMRVDMKKLMIVEDSKEVRDNLTYCLHNRYAVIAPDEGDEVMKLFKEKKQDLMLLD